jgi:phytanoyl-CoA hydroxylase
MPSDDSSIFATQAPSFDLSKFTRDGYLVIPNFLPPDKTTHLRQRVLDLLDQLTLENHPMTKFSTGEKEAHVGDDVLISVGLM